MKTIGIIGGMSWESTTVYYQVINREVARRLGGLHSAKILLQSLDFEPIAAAQRAGDWTWLGRHLGDSSKMLELAGADMVLIATNTMHKVYDEVAGAVNVPVVHIGDGLIDAARQAGVSTLGFMGTRFSMEDGFLLDRLRNAGLEVLVPDESGRAEVHRVIFEELCQSKFLEGSRKNYLAIIDNLRGRGAQAIALGCTEIGLLVKPQHTGAVLLDTAELHAKAAVNLALAE